VQRANIILFSADRLPVLEVARRAGVSRPAVWRWQARYAEQGVDGLLRDKTRKPGRAPLSAKVVAKVMDLTCSEPPDQATHWTGRAMAKAVGVSLRAVQRLWEAHRLQPHRVRAFKRSNDPAFAEKVEDVVGLYMDPPKHAVVVSIDEKSQIQALDRTQPGLPLKPGKCGTMTHDYKRNGATTLFAALNILDGTVIGRCMQRHRHQEFIRFLNAVERAVPPGKVVHAILDKLRRPQTTQGSRMAGRSSALDVPFHADLRLVAQRRRGLLFRHHAPPYPTRILSIRRRSAKRHRPLHQRPQRRLPALRLDHVRKGHLSKTGPDPCTLCLSQCTRRDADIDSILVTSSPQRFGHIAADKRGRCRASAAPAHRQAAARRDRTAPRSLARRCVRCGPRRRCCGSPRRRSQRLSPRMR
jgi:transposase